MCPDLSVAFGWPLLLEHFWSFLSTTDFLSLLFPLKASLIIKTLLCAAWLHRWSCSSAKHVHNTSRDIDLTGIAFNLSDPHSFLCKTGSSLTVRVCVSWLVDAWKLTDGFFLTRPLAFFLQYFLSSSFLFFTLPFPWRNPPGLLLYLTSTSLSLFEIVVGMRSSS